MAERRDILNTRPTVHRQIINTHKNTSLDNTNGSLLLIHAAMIHEGYGGYTHVDDRHKTTCY
jgi:hypothetical protein